MSCQPGTNVFSALNDGVINFIPLEITSMLS